MINNIAKIILIFYKTKIRNFAYYIHFSLMKSTTEKFIPDYQILLFDSWARNDNKKNCNYNFLIITKENPKIKIVSRGGFEPTTR